MATTMDKELERVFIAVGIQYSYNLIYCYCSENFCYSRYI